MTGQRRLTIVLGLTQTLAWATTYYVPAVITSTVAADLHVSPTALFGGFSWALLVSGLVSPRVGRRIEASGGRGVLAGGSLLMAFGLTILAAAHGLVVWYAGWTVLGVGMALGLYDAVFATLGQLLGPGVRPAIVGITLIAGFASTLGWPMGTALVPLLGWRGTLLVYAAIHLAVNLTAEWRLVPPVPPQVVPATAAAPNTVAGEQRAFWLLGMFLTLRAAISSVISVHVLTLMHGMGLSAGVAVGVAALIGPSQVGGRLLEWSLGRRVDPFTAGLAGAALLPIGAFALLGGLPAWAFAISYGASNGILTISRGTLPMHLFGPRGYAARLGRLALPQLLAQAVAPTLIAPAVAHLPALWTLTGLGAVGLLALGSLAAIVPNARGSD